MSKITVSNKQRVVDHSYSLSSDKIKNIIWFDDETGEYCWIVYDTTKSEHTEMIDKMSPGMLTLGGRLKVSYLSDVIKEYGGQEKEDSHKEWRELNPTTIEELLLQERWKIISSFMSSVLFEELLCKACGAKDNKHCDRWDCPILLDK